jgi:peptidoglycan/xylan/chitin deacetylase (PgdA/CDA1 family)
MIELPPWLNSGPKEKPRVGLTVDDEFGKEGIDNLEILLNICKEKNVRTTLFPTGGALQTHLDLGRQDVWRRAVAEGHEIGNHTYDHIALDKLSLEAIGAQLARQSEVLDKVLDYPYKMRYARPPGGAGGFNPGTYVDNAINKSGYTATMWSIGGDYADPGADFADAIVNRKNVKNGDIILTHFTTLPVQYFPQVIDGLRAKGLEPTTITGLFVP